MDWLPGADGGGGSNDGDATGSAPNGGEDYGYRDFMASVDVLVMGRAIFETVLGFTGSVGGDWRVPVLLGHGRPLFGDLPADVALRHLETRAFESGLVQSRYEVVRDREAD